MHLLLQHCDETVHWAAPPEFVSEFCGLITHWHGLLLLEHASIPYSVESL